MITSVGIGAYLGSAELVANEPILEVASASILTAEARHDAYLQPALVPHLSLLPSTLLLWRCSHKI